MRRLVYLSAARRDLVDILRYIARESGSPDIARRFTASLREQCAKLATLPGELGTPRPELRPDIRSFPYRGYVIFFRYADDRLESSPSWKATATSKAGSPRATPDDWASLGDQGEAKRRPVEADRCTPFSPATARPSPPSAAASRSPASRSSAPPLVVMISTRPKATSTCSSPSPPTLADLLDLEDALGGTLGREVDLVDRRAIEASRNDIRRRHILADVELLYDR